MKKLSILLVLLSGLAASCSLQLGTEIPQPYKDQIVKMRADAYDMEKQCADLERQKEELQAVINYNHSLIDQTAQRAINAAGYSNTDHRVDLGSLKIVSVK